MRHFGLALIVAATPFLMAPSCGAPEPKSCNTAENHHGAHAFEPDGTLVVLDSNADGTTWKRIPPPWNGPAQTVLSLAGDAGAGYLPELVATPDRLLVRGPVGPIPDELDEIDATGAHPIVTGDHVEFAAVFDGQVPYVLAGSYRVDGTATISFLQGTETVGTWSTLASFAASVPFVPADQTDAPIQGQPIALVREATGDLVGYEIHAGLAVVAANGALSQPAITLPHPSVVAAAATLSSTGEAVVFLLTEDATTMHLDRIRHVGGTWTVDTIETGASWDGQHYDRMNSQVAPIDDTHVVVLHPEISSYDLYVISQNTDGTWTFDVPCVSSRCDNVNVQQLYTRVAVTPGPAIALGGENVSLLADAGGGWNLLPEGTEGQHILHLCETCGVAHGGSGPWAILVVGLILLRRRRCG